MKGLREIGSVTFEKLKELEPKLANLEKQILGYSRKEGCIHRVWYGRGGIKEKMCDLVGDYRVSDEGEWILHNHIGYDVAYRHLYDSFPDCETNDCSECEVYTREGKEE